MPAVDFDADARVAARGLIETALAEDLRDAGDLTSQALIREQQRAEIRVVARQPGVLAGGPVAEMVFAALDAQPTWRAVLQDGSLLETDAVIAVVSGPLRSLLTGERTALNFLTHLSGIATLTRKYVDAVAGTKACILDTRKTIPGCRALQKYAVRCGGGRNHRMGLYDGVLIKDNHLAAWLGAGNERTVAEAVRRARQCAPRGTPIEVEVDTLQQLADALNGSPDIVLLDNMDAASLQKSVAMRDAEAPDVQLEASGGMTLENVAEVAATGVDFISVGALTHSAPALDLAFDWQGEWFGNNSAHG